MLEDSLVELWSVDDNFLFLSATAWITLVAPNRGKAETDSEIQRESVYMYIQNIDI